MPLPLAFVISGLIGVIFGLAAGLIIHTYLLETFDHALHPRTQDKANPTRSA